jgi:putative GTP pyrophosphokinase
MKLLRATESSITRLIADIEDEYAERGLHFPAEHTKIRIKSAESAMSKLERLGLPTTSESALQNLFDLVGVRIVCRFFNEVNEVARLICGTEGIEVVQVKDYVKNPKPNGYRSVHIILKIPVAESSGISMQYAEIQLRTIAMDFWASLEHELKYKKDIHDAKLMSEELKRCADEIISVDITMQSINEWLNQPQDDAGAFSNDEQNLFCD